MAGARGMSERKRCAAVFGGGRFCRLAPRRNAAIARVEGAEEKADYISCMPWEGEGRGRKKLLLRKLPFILRLWSGGFTKQRSVTPYFCVFPVNLLLINHTRPVTLCKQERISLQALAEQAVRAARGRCFEQARPGSDASCRRGGAQRGLVLACFIEGGARHLGKPEKGKNSALKKLDNGT